MTKNQEKSKITAERNEEVVKELYKVIFTELDIETATKILAKNGRACADSFARRLPPGSLDSLDNFLKAASNVGKEKIKGMPSEIQRNRKVKIEGNTIYWTLDNDGKCICHLLRGGIVEAHPRLGICCTNWVRRQIERFTDKAVRVELIDEPLQGGKECKFKVTIGGTEEAPLFDTKTGSFPTKLS
jgi:predicted hydrocarbon binding protein